MKFDVSCVRTVPGTTNCPGDEFDIELVIDGCSAVVMLIDEGESNVQEEAEEEIRSKSGKSSHAPTREEEEREEQREKSRINKQTTPSIR